jgi:hypothetical protein
LLLTLASTFILREESPGIITIFYRLKFETPNLEGHVSIAISPTKRGGPKVK